MSNRKIWSIPIALVALLMLAAVVFAAVSKGTQIPDKTLTIASDNSGRATVNFYDVDADTSGEQKAFTESDSTAVMAFTALTSDRPVGGVSLPDVSDFTVADAWYNALDGSADTDCSAKAAALGFTVTPANDTTTNPAHKPKVGQTDATGLCQDTDQSGFDAVEVIPDGNDDGAEADLTAGTAVATAFHWNMLIGSEMFTAAKAAGKTDTEANEYKKLFGELSHARQLEVVRFFGAANILASGQSDLSSEYSLTITNDGIDGTDTADDPEGKAGETTVVVKASSGTNLNNSVRQTFTVTAKLANAGGLPDFDPNTDSQEATSIIAAPSGSGNLVTKVEEVSGANPVDGRYNVRISDGQTKIANVFMAGDADSNGTGDYAHAPHQNPINFSLTNGGDIDFQIKKSNNSTAQILVRSDSTLTAANSPYKFTLKVNEFSRAPENSKEVDIWVTVVLDNVAPTIDSTSSSSATVAERANDKTVKVATITASDRNNQVLTFTIAAKTDGMTDAQVTAAGDVLEGFNVGGTSSSNFENTGVLRVTQVDPKKAAGAQPDFVEDDPETAKVDESMNCGETGKVSCNTHVYIIKATDGTLPSAGHEFTLTITDVDEPKPGSERTLYIDEDNKGGLANTIGKVKDLYPTATGTYDIGEQSDNTGHIEDDETKILFDIDPTGRDIFLKPAYVGKLQAKGEGEIYRYTLTVTETVTINDNVTTFSGLAVIEVRDVNEAPDFKKSDRDRVKKDSDDKDIPIRLVALEGTPIGTTVKIGVDTGGAPTTVNATFMAVDPDLPAGSDPIGYDLWYDADTEDADDELDERYSGANALVTVDSGGNIKVNKELDADEGATTVNLLLRAYDTTEVVPTGEEPKLENFLPITFEILDTNVAPTFDDTTASPLVLHKSIPETAGDNYLIATYNASDMDGTDASEGVNYVFRNADDVQKFTITTKAANGNGEIEGELRVKAGANLDVDVTGAQTLYVVELKVCDSAEACNQIAVNVNVDDVNDEAPMFATDNAVIINVMENTARDTALTSAIAADGVYAAPDADSTAPNNTVTYKIDHKSFKIDPATGKLTTLESLDADTGTPCGATGCSFKITATDGGTPAKSDTLDVTVIVGGAEDSVSTFSVSKANPVPGISMGDPDSALSDTKTGMMGIPERPKDQPAVANEDGLPGPDNFVSADWASWETVLRVAVTAQSPEAGCGMDVAGQNNNQCVWIDVESDSAGNKLRLAAYRSDSVENMFIAAVRVVEKDPTDDGDGKPGSRNTPVYMDADGGVAKLEADEEDKIIFRLVNSTTPPITIDVENENPEFNDFLPEHETAFDDGDVEYTFSVTDAVSGIPEPEDLAGDTDGDGDYMPLVALISSSQCQTKDPNDKAYSKVDADLTAGSNLWCKSDPEIRQVVDDRDFDEIDDGFEVATKVVLRENMAHYVTFIVCDNAGNCAMYTPDENKEKEALAEITIDDQDPDLIEARTGVKWDSTDSKYDDDPTFIQLLFNDLTALDPTSVEADDFDIEGHTIKAVYWYDVSDNDDDTAWGDGDDSTTPSRYAMGGSTTLRGHPLRQSIRNTVFIELEDELAPDETPDVTIVPNGILDSAGNEQDDDDTEADDWIAPSFTVVSMVSPGTPEGSSNQLAGDGDEVMITLTSNERIQQTRPIIEVTYVNAPSGCVNTLTSDDYARGQIKTGGDCGKNATGGTLGTTFERISNTEWVITVDEPDDTGYYNVYIKANDRSEQRNLGTEGIASSKIATKFFERDGDVNSDDAHYFQGDINLSNPGVRVSGVQIEETEPSVEFKTPLFVELDFTRPYIKDCANDISNDERAANCYAESDEYAKDSFDAVTVTSFTLNGTDMTDMVKTTDNETFLVSIEGIAIGDHEIEIQAMDQAGNTLDKALSVEFEVEERDDFSNRLSPGWNLVSLPGEPADSSISVVFGSDVEVRTVYTYDPIMPGGWMVAVRETVDADWQGDLTEITARRGYWVLSDAIQDWDVAIPRLAGGAVGSGTPIQPPVIALYAGWNLVPVIDVTGNLDAGDEISAQAYLQSLDDGLDLARVLGFNTITNEWRTIKAPETGSSQNLAIGEAYWVFVRQAASLVPGY